MPESSGITASSLFLGFGVRHRREKVADPESCELSGPLYLPCMHSNTLPGAVWAPGAISWLGVACQGHHRRQLRLTRRMLPLGGFWTPLDRFTYLVCVVIPCQGLCGPPASFRGWVLGVEVVIIVDFG